MSKDGSGPGGASHSLGLLIGGLILGKAYQTLYPAIPKVERFWESRGPHVLLCLLALGLCIVAMVLAFLWNRALKRNEGKFVTRADDGSVYLGKDLDTGEDVHLKADFRTMHTQAIGTTNAGKTGSITLPWAVSDIEHGRGWIIVDGKSDRQVLDKLYSYAVRAGRKKDFQVFSLANPHISSTFNPFANGTPDQIAERVFSAFGIDHEYYGPIQFSALRTIIALMMHHRQVPMPGVIRELLRDKEALQSWVGVIQDKNLMKDVVAISSQSKEDFEKNYSGLVTALSHFSQGDTAPLYNTRHPDIDLADALRHQKLCYFQLPTNQYRFLGATTGKLLLQSLQSAISELQVSGPGRLKTLFSVYLDDFNDYMYPEFTSLLNKSRSANVGVVFAHQSLGDLEKVGADFAQTVRTNTNVKIVMRSNDPLSAETFAKTIGTVTAEKTTGRRRATPLGAEDTGDESVREVEEYIIHPNVFKSGLGLGEGVVMIPHISGRVVKRVKFATVPDLPAIALPIRDFPKLIFCDEVATAPQTTLNIKQLSRRKPTRRDSAVSSEEPFSLKPKEDCG